MKTLKYILTCLTLLACFTIVSCKDDEVAPAAQYGYVQFKLLKNASRATSQLDNLRQAHKMRVVMQHEGLTIEQTLLLNAPDDASAEYGLRSDKLQLLTGDYTIVGFYLYDILDSELMACGVAEDERSFSVEDGGLTMHQLYCDVQPRGTARFMLTKEDIDATRAASDGADYLFSNIRTADITVRNLSTNAETTFQRLAMTLRTVYGATKSQLLYADTTLSLPAGDYRLVRYTTYSDKRGYTMLGTDNVQGEHTFTVRDNQLTDSIPCPIRLNKAADYMKDYLALREIWEALGGPTWRYVGEAYTPGGNWNFDKDIDMWGDQPGVDLDRQGRVTGINLAGFGIKGQLPDAIGNLTELEVLYLGTHDEQLGGNIQHMFKNGTARTELAALRHDYRDRVLKRDPMQSFSECIQSVWDKHENHQPIHRYQRMYLYDTQGGTLTNQLTGISRAIMLCTRLQQLYIANAPITSDNFWVDIPQTSPLYNAQINDTLSFRNHTMFTDLELYNCPRLTSVPRLFLDTAPEMVSVNLSQLRGISGDQLLADWNALIDGPSGAKVQLLYLGYNNLEKSPTHAQLKKMERLGLLDVIHNKLKVFEPFGKSVSLVDAYFDFNQLTELVPSAEDGYFCNSSDVETFSCTHNLLTHVPNIFNAKNVYVIGDVDFSDNLIHDFDTTHGAYKGINASTVNLSHNHFDRFPKELFETGSPIRALNLAGNKIKEIKEGEMKGSNSDLLESLDLQMNKLSRLPNDFAATNIPYLYGIDISYNQFDHVPGTLFDYKGRFMVLGMRGQRDDDGNRTLKQWPTNYSTFAPNLQAFYLGSNDIRKVDETILPNISILEIKDNPNISITLSSSMCQYVGYGYILFIYDPTQDIRGCDTYLDLEQ